MGVSAWRADCEEERVRHFAFAVLWFALAVLLALALVPRPARAAGLVVGADVTGVRVAIAAAPDRVTRWVSIATTGDGPLLWVIPIERDAAIDVSSPAWLEALDAATAPRIVPSCGGSNVEAVQSIAPSTSTIIDAFTIASDASAIDGALGGFTLASEQRAALEISLKTYDLAFVLTRGPTPPTLRIVDRGAPIVPMSLTSSKSATDVTLFVLEIERGTAGAIVPGPSPLHWFGTGSDYVFRRDALLASSGAGAMIVESSMPSRVFGDLRVSPTTVPSVALTYFEECSGRGLLTGSIPACLGSSENAATSVARYHCAAAGLGGNALFPCTISSPFTCGPRAEELAFGVGGFVPNAVWITRMFGRVAPNRAWPDLSVTSASSPPIDLVHAAQCGATTGRMSTNDNSYGDPSGAVQAIGAVADGCGSSSTPSDSSSSDSCGSSSDSASTDTSSCDSSSASDGSCDSGGGADACSGGEGGGDCNAARPKTARKSPVSRVFLGCALVLFPLRRLSRRRD